MTSNQNNDIGMTDASQEHEDLAEAMDVDTIPPRSEQAKDPNDKQDSSQADQNSNIADDATDLDEDNRKRGRTIHQSTHIKDSMKQGKKAEDRYVKMKDPGGE